MKSFSNSQGCCRHVLLTHSFSSSLIRIPLSAPPQTFTITFLIIINSRFFLLVWFMLFEREWARLGGWGAGNESQAANNCCGILNKDLSCLTRVFRLIVINYCDFSSHSWITVDATWKKKRIFQAHLSCETRNVSGLRAFNSRARFKL
jgi:hypothetical protein